MTPNPPQPSQGQQQQPQQQGQAQPQGQPQSRFTSQPGPFGPQGQMWPAFPFTWPGYSPGGGPTSSYPQPLGSTMQSGPIGLAGWWFPNMMIGGGGNTFQDTLTAHNLSAPVTMLTQQTIDAQAKAQSTPVPRRPDGTN